MRAYRRPVIAAIVSVGAILASTLSATASELPAAVSGSLNGSDTPRLLDDVYAEVARQVPGFAGIRFDGPDNVRVLLTMPDQRKAERARDSLAAMWRDPKLSARHAHATPARYDFLQLKDWYDRFNRDALALAGVVLTDIDEGGNRLRVGVDDEQRELDVREVARRHNVPQAALHVEQTGTIRQTSGLRDLHRPLVGGLQVQTTAYN